MFACQPSPERSAPASWKCSLTSTESGLTCNIVRRIVRATSRAKSSDAYRPVMFATSMRQPSSMVGAPSHRPMTDSGPSIIRWASEPAA